MISRNRLRQRVKDWLESKYYSGLNNGQIASFVCDLFGELSGGIVAEKDRIQDLRREDILAFISKESKLLEERDNAKDLARELINKLETEHAWIANDAFSEITGETGPYAMEWHKRRKPDCTVCALIERAKTSL